ncbi:MAG: hypothetical protein QM582_04870 [Micropruina sp.]|uniref:hypothetical protein n=1 Tax=Micropruina sp. TaxID=2737536 RepID=UPI0039E319D8
MSRSIRPVTDAAGAARLYDEIIEPSFPPTERVSRDEFVAAAASGTFEVLAARDGDGYLGAVVGGRHGAAYLVHWLAVGGGRRGGGTGSALVTAGVQRWLSQPGVRAVLAEIERPGLFAAHPQYGDPARRLAFYQRRGAAVLDLPYYQPAVAAGAPRVRNLLLAVLAARDPAPPPRVLTPEETAAVRSLLLATMGPAEAGDAETARVYAALDAPAGLRLLPLAEHARVPLLDPPEAG